jgi:hypothetical protein
VKYFFLILALVYTGCSTPKAAPPATAPASSTIRCNEHPLPEFTLDSEQSESEQAAVCDCIWSQLSERDRELATQLRNGRGTKASSMKSFPIRFGQAIGTCTSPSA